MMKDGGRNRIIISEEGVFEKVAMTNKLLMSLDDHLKNIFVFHLFIIMFYVFNLKYSTFRMTPVCRES